MKPRRLLIPAALLLTAALFLALPRALQAPEQVPGLAAKERTLLRIWVVSAPGGGQAWLTQQLKEWEKQHPGVMTHLRTVSAAEALAEDAVLPDIILHMPGDFTDPAAFLVPLDGYDGIREPLLQCGRFLDAPYGLPLCWGAWVMAIDSALEPGSAVTPAPTTLLGRSAATDAPTDAPGYPLQAASAAECPLQSPGGAAIFSLARLLDPDERPPLPDNLAQLSSAGVYAAFQARQCVTAMLTTGQATAFTSLVSAGKGFPFRIIVPEEIITDQVWLAGLTAQAPEAAVSLLQWLTGRDAQQALSSQGLHTVRDDLTLYATGFSAGVEDAAHSGMYAINAYTPADAVQSAAWQALHGTLNTSEALIPLL